MAPNMALASSGAGFAAAAPAAAAVGGKGFLSGDWTCPGCGDHQFARNAECRKCGTARPADMTGMVGAAGGTAAQKPGDWFCPACNDLQFAKNSECRKCATPNPDFAGSLAAKEAGIASGQVTLGENLKPGDW